MCKYNFRLKRDLFYWNYLCVAAAGRFEADISYYVQRVYAFAGYFFRLPVKQRKEK